MPPIRRWKDIQDLGGDTWLTPAEHSLIEACKTGEVCKLGDGELPPEGPPTPDRQIRADLLRYLILGGCEKCPVADLGVSLGGAYVSGALDLSFASAKGMTRLVVCRFQNSIKMLQTNFEFLHLSGSHLIGLNAQGARIAGNVFLRNTIATATINLNGAEIGGQLNCTGARLNAIEGHALTAQGARITDGVFLHDTIATATITLNGAEIGGQLSCLGAQLNATEGDALDAQSAQIAEGVIWRNIGQPSRPVSFLAAHTNVLDDDLDSWESGAGYDLDGFTYTKIYGSTDAHARIKWLEKGSYWGDEFAPQPFTQLAKVLREMGHDNEARKVLVRREQLLRRNTRDLQRITPNGDISVGLQSIWRDIMVCWHYLSDLILRGLWGYGHIPERLLFVLPLLVCLAAVPAHFAYEEGSFAPNSGPIQSSADWQDYANVHDNPAAWWSADGAPGQDWETFNPYAYAADLVIPIIDFGQTSAWAPSTTRGSWGWHLWWLRWVFALLGWGLSTYVVARLTHIIRRD